MTLHFPECGWAPTKIVRVIRPVKSSTQVVLVETDGGEAYLKGMENPAGNESLAFELVGSRLAKAVSLFVPDFAVIDNDLLQINRHDGHQVGFGPAFISRALPGNPGGGNAGFLSRLMNPFDIPLLVCFDTWVGNTDRFPPIGYYHEEPNWDNIFFVPVRDRLQLTVFDHTHCFAEGDLESALTGEAYQNDGRVYGAFPEFLSFCTEDALRHAANSICSVDDEKIAEVVEDIPRQWGVSDGLAREWARQIIARKSKVEKIVLDGLLAQRVMEFDRNGQ